MFEVVYKILTLLGALSLFLFGMKLMSEGLQKVAGTGLRKILAAITANRFKSLFTGIVLTLLIQSSSATTVMVVSFINAGLLSLAESIGIILGANIGTTITAWLIALLGFNLKISTLALPLIGLGFPLIFSAKSQRQYLGEFIIGFALIFTGLDFLKNEIPDIQTNLELFRTLSDYTHLGFVSVLLFVFIGLLVTSVIQSSSAAIALTLVMAYKGWIDFHLAAAMVLGENIGTTITANIAAFIANRGAKRAAIAHTIINLFGVAWILVVFYPFVKLVDYLVAGFWGSAPLTSVEAIPVGLATFHSMFNIINISILFWFTPFIQRLTEKLIKSKDNLPEEFKLKFISTGILSTAELSILQARKEISLFGKKLAKMFATVRKQFSETNDSDFFKHYDDVQQFEDVSDKMEVEIANYLTKISEGELSRSVSERLRLMLKVVDDLETIGDVCKDIAKTLRRKKKNKIWFTQDLRNQINQMFDLIDNALYHMNENLSAEYNQVLPYKAKELRKQMSKLKKSLHKEHLNNIENQSYTYQAGVIYTDIINQCELLSNAIYSITESIAEYNGSLSPAGEG